jgi:hypothetical protein
MSIRIVLSTVFFLINFINISWAQSSISNYIDLSYIGIFSGPSLEPSWNTPILVGEGQMPSNLRSQIKMGYRMGDNWSLGPLIDLSLSIDRQYSQFHNPAIAITKYDLFKFNRFSITADLRLFFLTDRINPSGIQSFQTTTYHLSAVPLSFTMYSFIHYELSNPGITLSGFPVLAYHLSNLIHPAVFIKSTGYFGQKNDLLELTTGPGAIFTPTKDLTLSVGLALTPTNPTLASSSVMGFIQSQIF